MDRYDELMIGLYRGEFPAWIPKNRQQLYARESVRRRCALGQALIANWRCTMYLARCTVHEEFAAQIYAAWAEQRDRASNVTTGLYLALDSRLRDTPVVWELFQYESMILRDLRCGLKMPRVEGVDERYRFAYAVDALHTYMRVCAAGAAPPGLARSYQPVVRATDVVRVRSGDGWAVEVEEP